MYSCDNIWKYWQKLECFTFLSIYSFLGQIEINYKLRSKRRK